MDLVPARASQGQQLTIAEADFQSYCATYVRDKVRGRAKGGIADVPELVGGLVYLQDKEALPALRSMLADDDLSYVSAAATWLGKLGDHASVPQLKQLLSSDRLRLPSDPRQAMPTDLVAARFSVAGALHAMGENDGLQALLDATDRGFLTFGALALRDTPEVEAVLKKKSENESSLVQAYAVGGLIALGQKQYVGQAIRLLQDKDAAPVALDAMASHPSPDMEAVLMKYAALPNAAGEERFMKVAAAGGLVRLGQHAYLSTIGDAVGAEATDPNGQYEIALLGELGGPPELDELRHVAEVGPENRLWAVVEALHIMRREGEIH
jgi:HEAT repeat protein